MSNYAIGCCNVFAAGISAAVVLVVVSTSKRWGMIAWFAFLTAVNLAAAYCNMVAGS
jgi:hypothetical protein